MSRSNIVLIVSASIASFLNVGAVVAVISATVGGGEAIVSNVAPLLLGFAVVVFAYCSEQPRLRTRLALLSYVVGSATVQLFIYSMWLFDIGGTATGSSTAGLVFLVAPAWSFCLGLALSLPALLAILIVDARNASEEP